MEYIDKMEFDVELAIKLVGKKDINVLKSTIKNRFKEIFIVQ